MLMDILAFVTSLSMVTFRGQSLQRGGQKKRKKGTYWSFLKASFSQKQSISHSVLIYKCKAVSQFDGTNVKRIVSN